MKPTKVVTYVKEVAETAANAGRAAVAVVKSAAKGEVIIVSDEVEAERLATCRTGCPDDLWVENGNAGFGKCKLCGCTRLKHKLASQTCPKGHWKR